MSTSISHRCLSARYLRTDRWWWTKRSRAHIPQCSPPGGVRSTLKRTDSESIVDAVFSFHSRRTQGAKSSAILRYRYRVRISHGHLSLFRFPFNFQLQNCLKSYGRGDENSFKTEIDLVNIHLFSNPTSSQHDLPACEKLHWWEKALMFCTSHRMPTPPSMLQCRSKKCTNSSGRTLFSRNFYNIRLEQIKPNRK